MQYFDYKTVATVVSDRLFDDHDRVNELIRYMTGRDVTRENARALMRVCRQYFLDQFPALKNLNFTAPSPIYYDCYVADFQDILGQKVPVPAEIASVHGVINN